LKFFVYTVMIFLTLIAQFISASEIKYNANFLQQFTTAESGGIGESLVAYSTGSHSLNNNPAGLSYTRNGDLLISIRKLPNIKAIFMKEAENGKWGDYSKYDIPSTEMGFINCALPIGKFGNLGMSFVLNYSGRFIRVNNEGKAINSFPEGDLAFVIGYSHKIFQNASFGFDVKSIKSKLLIDKKVNIGSTYAMNVGFMHQIGPRVRVGAVLQNIGNDFSFRNPDAGVSSELHRKLLFGATYILMDKENSLINLSVDVNPPFENGPKYNLGLEFLYIQHILFRIGYMRNTDEYYDQLTNLEDGTSEYESRIWNRQGITVGAGLKFHNMEINFAIAPIREPVLKSGEKLRLEDHKNIISLSCLAKL
jgi:hypothetical protein